MLKFKKDFPPNIITDKSILIFDKRFSELRWVKKFKHRYPVKAGEKLKSIDDFPKHIKKIIQLCQGMPRSEITIITLGGGSVGDFGGFVASVLKRGVKLIHVPSTWLAAIDSAHGGKTALNVAKIKNQIGTFYEAQEIYLVQKLLFSQDSDRVFEALGEVFKTALLNQDLWSEIKSTHEMSDRLLWQLLPQMIETKMQVVVKDPFEQSGYRHVLNLGHTLGHLLESQFKLPHGIAVLFGLAFSIEWSFYKKIMNSKTYYEIRMSNLGSYLPDRSDLKKLILHVKNPYKYFSQDKKIMRNKKINFVFVEKPGTPSIRKVLLSDILHEMQRQAR